MSDNDFLYSMLSTGGWISRDTILQWSQQIRGYGLTVHSRAADLRKRGHTIETRTQRNENGRVDSFYRLVGSLDETPAEMRPPLCASQGLGSLAGVSSSVSNPAADDAADDHQASRDGTLLLFECKVDESAGLRGAYGNEAA